MPSTFRATAAVVALAALLGLSTVPAYAQSKSEQAGSRAETKVLEQVWRWLTDLWASPGAREQVQKGPALVTDQSSSDLTSLNRGGAYDPNGHS